jgi:NodT family efflux transporter outer membrane factor (OMF) lipoprotein
MPPGRSTFSADNSEAAKADVQAAIEDQRDVLVSLLAEVARNYIDLRGYQRQYAIAQENLAAQQDTLQLTTSKFNAGFVTQLDVARQATQVATTAAALPGLEAQIHSSMHALGVLLGKDPDALAVELSAAAPIPPVPPEVPVGLPSELLRRRPDIRRAERRMAAATARVGEATADLYPKFSITGALGLDSTKPKHILDWSSKYWALSPGISWPIFDAGRVRANINVTNEVQKQALDDYQQTVLTALKDVEDSLSSYQTEQVRRAALADAVTAAQQAVELAKQQYNQGVVDFLTVLDAQRAEFATEDSLAQSDQAISTDLVSLYKALGGGWEITAAATQPPPG